MSWQRRDRQDFAYENGGACDEFGQPVGAKFVDPSSPPEPRASSPTQRRRKWLCGSRGLVLVFVLPAIVIASLVGVIIYSDIAAKTSPAQTGNHSAAKTSPPQTETFNATMKLDKLHYDPKTYGNPDSPEYQKLAGDFCSRVMTILIKRDVGDDVQICDVTGFRSNFHNAVKGTVTRTPSGPPDEKIFFSSLVGVFDQVVPAKNSVLRRRVAGLSRDFLGSVIE
ncbi:hypothetical protein LSAT2_029640 [Lamellibrachia satsuma]|nr:hypothetical protein LSAT2_029640 [Lamellibrachia satsuma]